MNSANAAPLAIGALGIPQVAALVQYLFGVAHVTPPSAEVAGTIAALVMIGGHAALVWLGNRKAVEPVKADPAPVAPPAQ